MASWLHPEKKSNQNQVPPLQQKSRIPVRVTRLSREGNRRPSSENGAYNKAQLERISVSKLQNKRPSRIPIPMDDRKDKVKVEVNLSENVKTTREEKFLGKNSVTGINLQETQEKHGKKRAISVTSTTAKYGSYIRAKKTKPKVRRRVPRQPSPIETEPKQVNLNKVYYLKQDCEKSALRANIVRGSGT
ncbi:uncharacterized protein LOC113686671 [Pocillopora damicornis]|uniref:uncharacterized protein LOC113686671 n=1 Tax=Pocillopora damicornis TaxID=46731 RepID=UPI000F555DEA|nr:uncharacterized protein LOC113686671 [Pocillopora damicornis]